MRFLKTLLCAATGFAAMFTVTALSAQDLKETYPKINEVVIEFDGFKSVSEQFVFSNIQLRPGMNYNSVLVDQSIRTLYGTGRFEFVEVRVDKAEGDTVDVVFEVIPKYNKDRNGY
jgi:outer membrane protein insertion porin family